MIDLSDFTCPQCGNKTYAILKNKYEKSIICKKCCETIILEKKKPAPPIAEYSHRQSKKTIVVECPYCHSKNTQKISEWEKNFDIILFRIQPKEWHCNNCNSDF